VGVSAPFFVSRRRPSAARGAYAHAVPVALAVNQLRKSFGAVVAVDGLDLEVPEGTCVGLLGPNGAGKSTTMRMLTGQTLPDSGTIDVLGWRLPGESKQARAQMGVVPQLDNLDTTLSAHDNLRIFAQLYRVPKADRAVAVARGLQIARLTDRADARADALSGGMRRRLLIARALLHRPRLLLLDEPTVGLDPQVRQELWAMIDGLRTEGTSILMTTHYIEEAERLADSVTIVAEGKAVDAGPPATLVARHAGREVREIYGPPDRLSTVEADARAAGFGTRRTGTSVAVLGAEGAGDRLPEGEIRAARLEDVFVKLTGEEVA
jgi:lipooligosaccharide transport system ATP-binding protein